MRRAICAVAPIFKLVKIYKLIAHSFGSLKYQIISQFFTAKKSWRNLFVHINSDSIVRCAFSVPQSHALLFTFRVVSIIIAAFNNYFPVVFTINSALFSVQSIYFRSAEYKKTHYIFHRIMTLFLPLKM